MNFAVENYKAGDGIILFDYIQGCELSTKILEHIKDAIVIDLANPKHLSGLGYPEVECIGDDAWSRLETANIISRQVEYLLNSLSEEPLTGRMGRYLDAASKVVFIHKGGKVSDVLDVLCNHITRARYIIKALESKVFTANDNEIVDLRSLDDISKKTQEVIGTKDSKIEGIIDRATSLQKDLYLRTMSKREIDYSQNFSKWLDEGKCIIIQMPERKFPSKQVRDTICTYYMSRIWLATQQRQNYKNVSHLIVDEIHQAPTMAKLVSNIVAESRRYGIAFCFTLHYFNQFRLLKEAIKSVGCSYMLLSGTEKENIKSLQEEIKPFTIEEGLSLKQFNSLNVISIGSEYAKFITKLPKPL